MEKKWTKKYERVFKGFEGFFRGSIKYLFPLYLDSNEWQTRGISSRYMKKFTSTRRRPSLHFVRSTMGCFPSSSKVWGGVKKWESVEGALCISCSTDGLGHVRMVVLLHTNGWRVEATALTEAGQLQKLADAIRRFIKGEG